MNLPGFTAQKSLSASREPYAAAIFPPLHPHGAMVTPQLLPPHCGPCRGTRLCCNGIDCFPVRCGCR